MSEISIKSASSSDAPLLARIHEACFGDGAWSKEQLCSSLSLPTTQGQLAHLKDNPVGFILYQMTADQAEILTFCILPNYRCQRSGEKLLRHVLDSGAKTVFLEVAADNTAACALYKKVGFKINGRRPNYYKRGATMVDAVMYVFNR